MELDQICHSCVGSGLRKTVLAIREDDWNPSVFAGLSDIECVLTRPSGGVPD